MSGSKEELPTAPDEAVEPEAAVAAEAEEAPGAAAERAEAESKTREALAEPAEVGTAPNAAEAEEAPEDAAEAAAEPAEAGDEASEAAAKPAEAESEARETPGVTAGAAEMSAAEALAQVTRAVAGETAESEDAARAAKDEIKPAPVDAKADRTSGTSPRRRKRKKRARGKPTAATPAPDRPELRPIREAIANRESLEGRVIGWNNGGFHLALGELSAFCPRSEMELGEIQEPESYLDRSFPFRVLRLQGKGRRIVVSRAAHLRNEQSRQRGELRKKLKVDAVLDGTVASLKDFGAFVDLGGAQGLVHVSEISHRRVEHPSDVLSEGQQVQVKVLKLEQGGRRISLSIRALEPDPWKDLADRFPRGAVVKGKVEKANQIGAFIELAPGLTGLLPARSLPIPRETTPARAYPPGKEVSVQIVSVDPRRQRIALALEGSGLEGSRTDYKEYQRQSGVASDGEGFNALASAFRRMRREAD